ncbi:putative rtn-like domain protein [Klebsiella pneumoniae JHCK1]|nr:putative rtn-like domain protein [Klebsiella pneumoniae JHCK1]
MSLPLPGIQPLLQHAWQGNPVKQYSKTLLKMAHLPLISVVQGLSGMMF